MANRVKDDPSLRETGGGEQVLERPVIIVEQMRDGSQKYLIFADQLDPRLTSPELFGVLLSDLLDHIASTYTSFAAEDEASVRARILKTMLAENRMKEKDPSRGNPRGATGGRQH